MKDDLVSIEQLMADHRSDRGKTHCTIHDYKMVP